MTDLFNKLLILRMPRIGAVRYGELVRQFGSVAAAADAVATDAVRDAVLREMDAAQKLGIQYICDTDAAYPAHLGAVKNHPPVICVRGNIDVLSRPTVAMVGTRHATAAGMEFISDMAAEFASHGYAVASGMAIGTDSAAHTGALRVAGTMQTIAVLAGGADYVWPAENESLYREIVARGAVVTEMPVGFVPKANNFMQRNRWIAGMAEKLILGEADINSGSMATARFAIEYNRPVFAVPSHPADSRAAGPNSLIKSGAATLCDNISDFFATATGHEKKSYSGTESENELLDKLGMFPVSESVLAQIVKKSVPEIKRDLVLLELRGLVRKQNGGYVRV